MKREIRWNMQQKLQFYWPIHIITDTRHLKHLNLSYCNSLILMPLNLGLKWFMVFELKWFQNIYKYTVRKQ